MDIIVGSKIIGGHTVETQQADTINIKYCSGKTYDNASTMAERTKRIYLLSSRENNPIDRFCICFCMQNR